MVYKGYAIVHYHPELKKQTLDLMQYLWGDCAKTNQSYFDWKYLNNPCAEQPLGIVALDKGKVVGFRGYFATKWFVGSRKSMLTILCPGDTCVHPEHRQKGLSVAMGDLAGAEYSSKYKLFFNMSSTKLSVPGYLRMGFLPLTQKSYITKCNIIGLIAHIVTLNQHLDLSAAKFTCGEYDAVTISNNPRPEEMSSLIKCRGYRDSKLTLLQDEHFFRWRFNNKKTKYLFCYAKTANLISGYVVLSISPNNRRGYILDYAESESGSIERILQHIIRLKCFSILSIFNFGVDDNLRQILKTMGFGTNTLIRKLEKLVYGECPLLIRPTQHHCKDGDWFVGGLDLRIIENWNIKPICSDAV